jgi:hypothetical protein
VGADSAAATRQWGEPASASAYGTFAGQVAARYGPMGVNTYEIWNEENNQAFWYPAPNPSLYTAMLKDAYAAIKAVQPGATVISGGLAPAADDGAGDIAPIEFLQDMYADGARGASTPWATTPTPTRPSPTLRDVVGLVPDGPDEPLAAQRHGGQRRQCQADLDHRDRGAHSRIQAGSAPPPRPKR